MVHIPPAYAPDFWCRGSTDPSVELSCLLPNGIFIPLEVSRTATLQEVKEDLWEEAAKYPLHWSLHGSSAYVFCCINSMCEKEQVIDENRRLCDIRPFCCLLQVIERKGAKVEETLDTQISHLIGKGLSEFDTLKSSEVNDFRWKMKMLVDDIAQARQHKSWLEKMHYQFPPRLAATPELPANIKSRLQNGNIICVNVKFENAESSFTIKGSTSMTPKELLKKVLNKKAVTYNTKEERTQDYALKVLGREEYLIGGDVPLSKFIYIQECIALEVKPILIACPFNSIMVEMDNLYEYPESLKSHARPSASTLTLRKKGKYISSWSVDKHFQFTVQAISRLNCDDNRTVEAVVLAGIFHGGKSLCETRKTCEISVVDGSCQWNEDLVFDLSVRNIPRAARLCLVVYEMSRSAKKMKSRRVQETKDLYIIPLAWVNTTIYDFKNQLKSGAMTLYMWTYAEDTNTDDLLHPLGTIVSNTNVDHATALTITFPSYGQSRTVVYPTPERMAEHLSSGSVASESKDEGVQEDEGLDVHSYTEEDSMSMGGGSLYEMSQSPPQATASPPPSLPACSSPLMPSQVTQEHIDFLKMMGERDPLLEMHEQERKDMWALREECMRRAPYLLPKLLDCVEWNDFREVADAILLLQKWPKLPVEKALELLDYAYADQTVRSFAVQCLEDVSDDDLLLYLLQLVQALKHESYLHCDLVEYLLRRALNNSKIGHYLFWHLRSEMQVPSVSVRFGLILEAYLRGSKQHLKKLTKESALLDKLKTTSDVIRMRKGEGKEKSRAFLQEYLNQPHCMEAFSNVLCPLDPSFRCKKIKPDRCKVMDSKMRPLWIVFENDDQNADDIYVIFKNGDDLRQDMLTLQMIRIMDKLWKNEGLDLRMNPYGCISTEHRLGMIEVVLHAETIANIQKEKGKFSATSAFRKGSLLTWLKEHNQTEEQLSKAIEEFTLSCAGYCVATYVLGVADRHSDNIMVKKSGQLFHIDFGHILGHFKEKFGFRRERVPFVLTHDFVHVINKGQAKKEAKEFQRFQGHCEEAFQILRRHGGLILSLFAMMISTGLPELSSEKDLGYLRDTLVLDLSNDDALTHFRSKFDEALCNSWKTSLNWASHNLAKNN
ncbi:phosphatidylinositol 4,5-bisphosphate 3-kinase catalytic subunit delta isoform [Ischnura elegans]|uniref:phosphatidylinositol 4,5-bisphosphate 3-kinase catalytic subunit delta isoform n=1 Tax=Ischnura elegans TaxID=197161 RepID=UPI001ED88549|nr:phosphatidylinositol 4,5-bisphosphate 3-kinase catalytic subunit delta isoform [Ischnura elegans]XP_046389934.1 phosphatidylinositol 4,5-bisphosphate 3-kinase catalytic subunit delta isoform [Ischnura elegans]